MEAWWNFFYLCGSAAVTLMGLMFVAVTLGSAIIKKETLPHADAFLSPLYFHFVHVFLLSAVIAVPGHDPRFIGGAAVISGLWRLFISVPRTCFSIHAASRKEDSEIELSDWFIAVFFPVVIYVIIIAAGAGFLLARPWAVYWLAAGCALLLVNAMRGAWDMMLWIAATVK